MIKQLIKAQLEFGKQGLESTFKAMPEDKLTWRPLDNGRPALDLFSEAAQVTGMIAKVLETRGEFEISGELFAKFRAERTDWTREYAIELLENNFVELKAQIDALSDEELATVVTNPLRGGMSLPLAGWAMLPYRTYISRFAQINYIQTLYGDFEFH